MPEVVDAHKRIELQAQNVINEVVFSADGRHIFGRGFGNTLHKWRVEDGQEVPPKMEARGKIYSVAVSPDGRWIVTGDWGQRVIVWAASTHQKVLEISDHSGNVNAVDVSSDSTRIASGSDDQTARIFGITNGNSLISPLRHDDRVYDVRFSPTGDRIATATRGVASVRVYDVHNGNILFDIPVEVKTSPITPLSWSADEQYLFVTSPGKITRLDLSNSSRLQWTLPKTESNTSIVTNGRFIACSTGSSVSFWDAFSQKQIGPPLELTTTIRCFSLSPDDTRLACAQVNQITIHDLTQVLPPNYLQAYPLSQPPLMLMTEPVLESWSQANLSNTETILSEEITHTTIPKYRTHALANRSLVRTRLCEWDSALADANESLCINSSSVAYIAIALCLIGQGKHELALQEFDIAFHNCNPNDNIHLLLVKAVLSFVSGKHEDALSRIHRLITVATKDTAYYHHLVLANMYLKLGEYDRAVQILERTREFQPSTQRNPLVTISLIFGWTFEGIESMAYQQLCESLYASGRIKELGEALSEMVEPLDEDEKEVAHGRVLSAIVTRSGEVTMLAWTGRPSSKNSCLPSFPTFYSQTSHVHPSLVGDELEKRMSELRTLFPPLDAGIVYGRVTRLQPVRFAHFRLHLPCIVFPVRSLQKSLENVYTVKISGLGEVEFTTADPLPLKEARQLVLVNPWIRYIEGPTSGATCEDDIWSDLGSDEDSVSKAGTDTELVRVSIVEEVPQTLSDDYTRALQLIARLGQPFSALLLLKQPDGSYKRVASDHEIVVPGLGLNVSKDIRVEVLEVL